MCFSCRRVPTPAAHSPITNHITLYTGPITKATRGNPVLRQSRHNTLERTSSPAFTNSLELISGLEPISGLELIWSPERLYNTTTTITIPGCQQHATHW